MDWGVRAIVITTTTTIGNVNATAAVGTVLWRTSLYLVEDFVHCCQLCVAQHCLQVST
jgi:hypothetical protein